MNIQERKSLSFIIPDLPSVYKKNNKAFFTPYQQALLNATIIATDQNITFSNPIHIDAEFHFKSKKYPYNSIPLEHNHRLSFLIEFLEHAITPILPSIYHIGSISAKKIYSDTNQTKVTIQDIIHIQYDTIVIEL